MLSLRFCPPILTTTRFESVELPTKHINIVVCAQKGPRERYPRVWKTKKKIGTISKSVKLVECIKELSNVKEEVYGALDSFVAWELEFPLITVKKALQILENNDDWKRIIQVTKWMLSKGQGKTMGSYYTLLNALAEDGRIEEAEELWEKLFSENLESTPRKFFDKMVEIYYNRGMHDKMFEIFADMEELGVRPSMSIVSMVGEVFQKIGMLDKYNKLKKKYPPPKWEYLYIRGKRVKVKTNQNDKSLVSRRNAYNRVKLDPVETCEDAESPSDELLDEEDAESPSDELLEEFTLSEDFKESINEFNELVSELRD